MQEALVQKKKFMQEAREQWSWRGRESREDAPEEVMMDDGVWSDGVNSAIVWWIDKPVAMGSIFVLLVKRQISTQAIICLLDLFSHILLSLKLSFRLNAFLLLFIFLVRANVNFIRT